MSFRLPIKHPRQHLTHTRNGSNFLKVSGEREGGGWGGRISSLHLSGAALYGGRRNLAKTDEICKVPPQLRGWGPPSSSPFISDCRLRFRRSLKRKKRDINPEINDGTRLRLRRRPRRSRPWCREAILIVFILFFGRAEGRSKVNK